jgi:hypothetical protein
MDGASVCVCVCVCVALSASRSDRRRTEYAPTHYTLQCVVRRALPPDTQRATSSAWAVRDLEEAQGAAKLSKSIAPRAKQRAQQQAQLPEEIPSVHGLGRGQQTESPRGAA